MSGLGQAAGTAVVKTGGCGATPFVNNPTVSS